MMNVFERLKYAFSDDLAQLADENEKLRKTVVKLSGEAEVNKEICEQAWLAHVKDIARIADLEARIDDLKQTVEQEAQRRNAAVEKLHEYQKRNI